MKKYDIPRLINTFGTPVLLVILGSIMLLRPDSAAVLIARILGWILVAAGIFFAAPLLTGRGETSGRRPSVGVVCLILGIWLLCNPMILASAVGRVLGFLLLITNGRRVLDAWKGRQSLPLLDCICTGVGILLVLVPLSASRLAISLVGLVLMGIGIAEFYDRLKGRKYLEPGDDPNIIDAL